MIVQQRATLGSLRAVSCEREIERDDRASDRLQLRLLSGEQVVRVTKIIGEMSFWRKAVPKFAARGKAAAPPRWIGSAQRGETLVP
jgi:hypothetical protein